MYTVYALNSLSRNYLYVGMTSKLDERIIRHNKGYEKTTKPYRPFELFYTETFSTRIEARRREKYLKSGVGKEYLKSLLKKK
ncbi:MAG: GIY-YIG nuclease family protein [Melioribacteraceae bacterium]|nr:GIY-YIG nuclease family protein [Melioribacteraceae bacterium]MCF8354619.1 GIY-YIG nuclease family protein [Melioribacteraceae bacterium]MCF8395007.1 GIY-YIG nuclease family protein [Melioribacteraceae bacterium]MCF8418889.1 GIY-YIG nuclease family protein [Melioribacteraceae bacterium]